MVVEAKWPQLAGTPEKQISFVFHNAREGTSCVNFYTFITYTGSLLFPS